MKFQKHYRSFLLLLCLFIATACKQDRNVTSEEKEETVKMIIEEIDGVNGDGDTTSNEATKAISQEVLKARESILRKQIEDSKMISMPCEEILEKYSQAMKAAKEGDMSKLLAIDPNDPIFNKCRNSEPFKSKFEAIDLEYAN